MNDPHAPSDPDTRHPENSPVLRLSRPGFAPRLAAALLASCAAAALLSAQTVAPSTEAQPPAATPASAVNSVHGRTLYNFSADGVDLKQALALFARANNLNIVPDLDVTGAVTVDFRNLPLDLAMEALLDAHGYYFVREGDLIRVRDSETRLFDIDYIQMTRAGAKSNFVSVTSGTKSKDDGSTMAVTAASTTDFWADVRDQVQKLLTTGGSMSVNSLAGTILVTDKHRNVERVAAYLDSISRNVNRQVELQIEIYEVSFKQGQQLGIDWERVSHRLDATFEGDVIVRNPEFGGNPAAPAITITHQRGDTHAVLEALKQEGQLSIVSKPRLRTLNNQPAVLRVGQDYPYFLSQISQTTTAAGINRDVSETLQVVTIGTVLSITPRVSSDGIITLDITPAVTRLVGEVQSAELGNRAPIVDIRQAASIVRVRDGNTVTLAGLVQTTTAKNHRKIPLLGDIPVLGKVFTGTYDTEEKTELVVFVTPTLVKE